MESTSSEDDSRRDQNVDLDDDHIENHMDQVDMNSNPSKENLENGEPFVVMEYESEEAAKVFYIAYAGQEGFSEQKAKL
ncbi:unnamed protein product [Urochloa humidicola]